MSTRKKVRDLWNQVVNDFLDGAGPEQLPEPLDCWFRAYQGKGRGRVETEAMPEPYGGSLASDHAAAVFLDLNPGRADLAFQGQNGIWAEKIHELGSYDAFSGWRPYLSSLWTDRHGPNRHSNARLKFMHRWYEDPALSNEGYRSFELYPWHSTGVTAPMRPDPDIIRQFIWEPIAELGNPPVFAFGAPWFPILETNSGLREIARLGKGGRPYGSAVPSRSVLVMASPTGGLVLAEKKQSFASPPSATEVARLREAVQAIAEREGISVVVP